MYVEKLLADFKDLRQERDDEEKKYRDEIARMKKERDDVEVTIGAVQKSADTFETLKNNG